MHKPLSRRSVLQLAGGVSLSTLLTACFGVGGSASLSSQGSAANITIWDVRTGKKQTLVQQLANNFNKSHPTIHAAVDFFPNSSYQQKVSVALGAHNPPDLYFSWGGGILKSAIDAGDIYDLTPVFQSYAGWQNKFLPSVMRSVTFNDKIYGIPNNGTQPNAIYYNKDLFASANVQPPTTWSELQQVAQTLKQKGIQPFALGAQSQWPCLVWLSFLVDRLGGPTVFEAVLNNTPEAWSHPAMLQALTLFQKLATDGYFGPKSSFLSTNYPGDMALLTTGKAAMCVQGVFAYSAMLVNAPDFLAQNKLGWFAFPGMEDGSGDPSNVTGNLTTFYVLTKDSKHQDAALTYLKEVVDSQADISGQVALGSVPPVKGIEAQLASAPHGDFLTFTYQLAAKAPHFQLSWDQALAPTPTAAVYTASVQLAGGQITPQQFVDTMNKTIGS
jgi:raffinose/stachyose/melibiose transport system substrate-binding protein